MGVLLCLGMMPIDSLLNRIVNRFGKPGPFGVYLISTKEIHRSAVVSLHFYASFYSFYVRLYLSITLVIIT